MRGTWIPPVLGLIALPGTALPQQTPRSTSAIAAQSIPATVTVLAFSAQGDTIGHGSGFAVRDHRLIVTSWHVVQGAAAASVKVRGDPVAQPATILSADSSTNLAVLQIAANPSHSLRLATSLPSVGTRVIIIGDSLGHDGTVSEGIISAIRTDFERTVLQLSTPLDVSSSGGPVLDEDGFVVGVATSYVEGTEQLSLATPIGNIEQLLRAHGSSTRAGTGVRSIPRALEGDTLRFLEDAALATDPAAQYELGMRYAAGLGVPQDYEQSVVWYQAAAQRGFARAQFNLGVMYAFGVGVERDDREAQRWVRRAAEQGDAEAQYNLGMFYSTGTGVVENDVEAVRWYRRAAAQEFPAAEYSLGHMYRVGRGVPQDETMAASWFRRSAEHGHADAQQTLASMYAFGQGVSRDYVEAHKWFSLAATLHGGRAINRAAAAAHMRDIMEARMTPGQIAAAEARALEWHADRANSNH